MQVLTSDSETGSGQQGHLTDVEFATLQLPEKLLQGISDAGFSHCTPIQSKALPLALSGQDVAGQAQTGTGKTAAYVVALFSRLDKTQPTKAKQSAPRAVVLAPTRELAVQIHSDAVQLGKHLPFKLALAYGGTDYEEQRRTIANGVDVLIGTPGRLIDYHKQKVFTLGRVEVMVLDEADRMFDLGFIRDIRYVLRRLPDREKRLNMLFSATLSHRVLELAYEHMNDPKLIRIEAEKMTVDRVRQRIYFPSNEEKIPLLITLLSQMDARRTMVFVNTRREADRLQNYLEHNGIHGRAISGDVPQRKRSRMLKEFHSGDLPVLIGTDVASRGLHIPDVTHVFNYDLPQDAEDYVHRIGRTARAGASGDAISFGCEDTAISLPDIEQFIGHKIPVEKIDPGSLVQIKKPPRRPKKPRSHQSQPSRKRRESTRKGPRNRR